MSAYEAAVRAVAEALADERLKYGLRAGWTEAAYCQKLASVALAALRPPEST